MDAGREYGANGRLRKDNTKGEVEVDAKANAMQEDGEQRGISARIYSVERIGPYYNYKIKPSHSSVGVETVRGFKCRFHIYLSLPSFDLDGLDQIIETHL